jgi:hypothetical protein
MRKTLLVCTLTDLNIFSELKSQLTPLTRALNFKIYDGNGRTLQFQKK